MAILNKPRNCFLCYYAMSITPTIDGQAKISTCCTNIEKHSNYVVVDKDILKSWNAKKFMYQRHLTVSANWSYCYGNKCMAFRMYPAFEEMKKDKNVKNAIKKRELLLNYYPKVLWITTSFNCNNSCKFCYQKYQKKYRDSYILNNNFLQEIKEALIPKAELIVFAGGEPFLTDVALINFTIDRYPGKKVRIGTNGILLHQFEIDKIIRSKIRLTISVYGFPTERIYNKITRSNNFRYLRDNISKLISLGYGNNLILDYMVLNTETLDNLDNFLNFVRKNKDVRAIIRDNHWENKKYQQYIKDITKRYPDLLNRIKIYLRGLSLPERIAGKVYNKFYDMHSRKIINTIEQY